MKGPIKASWKYSARAAPSSAAPLLSALHRTEPWLTCELQRVVAVIRAVPGPATRPAVVPCWHSLKEPLPPSEEANKNDKLSAKELQISHVIVF